MEKEVRYVMYARGIFYFYWLYGMPVVQSDVPAVKNASLDDAIMMIANKFWLYWFWN